MTHCLLTGIGGSIGCHVYAHIMHNTDWKVSGIDSFRHKGITDRVVEISCEHPEWADRTAIYTHDLVAPISWKLARSIGVVDIIINCASLSDVFASIENPVPFVQNNVALMLNMLEYARLACPRAFLQLSTDEIYGPTDGKVMHKEWDPIVPSNPYSASKAAQEAIGISYWRSYGVPLIIVNLMNNFGEMQSTTKFPAIVQNKLRKGECVIVHGTPDTTGSRYYIHSRNSADAFLHILNLKTPHKHIPGSLDKPDRWNIVPDVCVKNNDLVTYIAHAMRLHGPAIKYQPFTEARPGHDRHYGLDGNKLATTGWKQPLSFEDSLCNTVNWYEEHPEWLEPTK